MSIRTHLKTLSADVTQLTLTLSELALIGGLTVKLSSVVLRDTQQRPHEVRQILCTQTATALFAKQLENRQCIGMQCIFQTGKTQNKG